MHYRSEAKIIGERSVIRLSHRCYLKLQRLNYIPTPTK